MLAKIKEKLNRTKIHSIYKTPDNLVREKYIYKRRQNVTYYKYI